MNQPSYPLRSLAVYFLKLGTWGFGGPVALVGYMHRDLVERRRWIAEDDYREGLALAQLAPGPLAAQLGIYLGYVHYGIWGASLCGLAFVLPSFLMVLALGVAYVAGEGLPWMQGVFYGVGAAVTGIIALSAWKLTARTVGKEPLLWGIYLAAGITTVWRESEEVWLFLFAGVLYWLVKAPPRFKTAPVLWLPLLIQAAPQAGGKSLWHIALYFTKAGAFIFGSGLAIVPFLYGGVVKTFGWLNEREFLDAVAVAMITPGPVVITTGFIGFLVAGFPGACTAAFATFFPCYLFTILPAPYFKKYGKHPGLKAFVTGVTAAAAGAISGAVIVLGRRSMTDGFSIAVAVVTAALLWRFSKIPEPLIIVVAAVLGLLVRQMA